MVGKSTICPLFWLIFSHCFAFVAVFLNTRIFLFFRAEYALSSFVVAHFKALSAFSRSIS